MGSGIRKIVKYTKIYSGTIPEFKDDEIFKVKIPLSNELENDEYVTVQKLRELILDFIKESDGRSRQEINDYIYPILKDSKETMNNRVRTTLTYLRKKDLIENSGSDTKSSWKKK